MDAVTEIRPRTGKNYIDAIKGDGRKVFIDGEEVNDVTTHPAFREAIKTTARLYDIASKTAKLVQKEMENATILDVPLYVDIKQNKNLANFNN